MTKHKEELGRKSDQLKKELMIREADIYVALLIAKHSGSIEAHAHPGFQRAFVI